MGADTFATRAHGSSANEAFQSAVKRAQYDYGHAGYTGTIAEKSSFLMLTPSPEKVQDLKLGGYLHYEHDDPLWKKVDNKWGPAGCIDLGDGEYFFFGWASS